MTTPDTCADCGLPKCTGFGCQIAGDHCERERGSYGQNLCAARTIARMRPVVEAAARWFTADDPAACIAAHRSLKAALESNGFVPKPSPVEVAELIEAASR